MMAAAVGEGVAIVSLALEAGSYSMLIINDESVGGNCGGPSDDSSDWGERNCGMQWGEKEEGERERD